MSANTTVLRAFATELFPTSQRGTAMGLSEVLGAVGSTIGLAVLGLGTQTAAADGPLQAAFDRLPFDLGNVSALARMTSLLSFAVAVAGLLVPFLPETKQRELETISPEAGFSPLLQAAEPRGASSPGSLPLGRALRAREAPPESDS